MTPLKRWTPLAALLAGALVAGCGPKRISTAENTPKPLPEESAASVGSDASDSGKYTVKKHDTLWAIAGKQGVYGDPFEWPLVFKANRESIQDPDLIYPRQTFRIEKGVDAASVRKAKKAAEETPKYVPHTKPRETLPVDYF